MCIWQSGTATCPAEYPNETGMFSRPTDSRDCTSCSSPSGRSCTGTVDVYAGVTYLGLATTMPTEGASCTTRTLTSSTDASLIADYSLSGGSCASTGGTPTGTAVGSGRRTTCCAD